MELMQKTVALFLVIFWFKVQRPFPIKMQAVQQHHGIAHCMQLYVFF